MRKLVLGAIGGIVTGVVTGVTVMGRLLGKTVEQKSEKINKFKGYYNTLNQWLILKQEGKNLETYFLNNDYKTIAIYGMGEIGNRLYNELKDSEIEIKYAIDKNVANVYADFNVVEIDDELEEVDVIIVTTTFIFDEVAEKLENKVSASIISIDDVVYNI